MDSSTRAALRQRDSKRGVTSRNYRGFVVSDGEPRIGIGEKSHRYGEP
jgi:hypothetical protein